ncbi:hypothetical protein SAMN05660380_00061 [Xylella fastidiosa]|jgi:hypothetical protein|uniref:Secreted protein n=1 Tax=Xylella fastidiosa (strain M23) TaxID=405441 RepID=B2I991_XYLF2|nr:hypothetical protein XfasM23_1947 [Xylella fastidiosa M23]SHG20105.1 hypothetical protein SAMN05660380_00061 [Xylella fastidiosa]
MGVCCILLSVRALCLADVLAVLLGSVHEDAMAVGADGLGMTLAVMGCPRASTGTGCELFSSGALGERVCVCCGGVTPKGVCGAQWCLGRCVSGY